MSQYLVLFEVKPTEAGKSQYLEIAAKLKALLEGFDGLVRMERFQSLDDEGKVLSMHLWESEEALIRWRNTTEHRMGQMSGKSELFESYKITVLRVRQA